MKHLTNKESSDHLSYVPGMWKAQILYKYLEHFAQGYAVVGPLGVGMMLLRADMRAGIFPQKTT